LFSSSLFLLLETVLTCQLTTGTVEGLLRDPDGHIRSNSQMVVTGGAGFRAVFRTNSNGEFALTLPYGRYELSGVAFVVAPLQISRVDLVVAEPAPGRWTDPTRGRVYPEGFNLAGVLLSREPASVSEHSISLALAITVWRLNRSGGSRGHRHNSDSMESTRPIPTNRVGPSCCPISRPSRKSSCAAHSR
jgi:hypothetical protein